jgi:mono/diheme cytochrome c family protein
MTHSARRRLGIRERWRSWGLVLGTILGMTAAAPDDALFRDQVAPVLEKRCVGCHNETTAKGKLSLATRDAMKAGGASGPALVPGKPDESLILDMIAGDPPEMPKKGAPLTAAQVASLRRWVERGAAWPDGLTLRDRRLEGETWWAFEPLARPSVPTVKNEAWVRTPIDAFILAKLVEKGLKPRPEADRRALIRRLSYDLTGLPPTPREIDAFLSDDRPDAYDRLVDRLLASPRYGERWGRHWLDVVHYGDTHGYDKDKRRDHAWPYRDYVIQALNDDLPYSRFLKEQIAGDVLRPGDPRGVIATGFIAAGPWDFVGHVELREGTVDKLKARLNDRDDMLASTMQTFQSLTVHCARCHDHKFDPITQQDYYRLQAVFAGVERGDRPMPGQDATRKKLALESRRAAILVRREALNKTIEDRAAASPEFGRLDQERESLRARLDALPRAATIPSPSNGYHSGVSPTPDVVKWAQVDLGRRLPIEEIRLVPARPTDFPDSPGFGFPVRFRVELADNPEMTGAVVVADHSAADFANPGAEHLILRAEGREARFARVTAARLWKRTNDYVFALGELEVISGGRNVAAKAAVTALDSIEAGRWSRANLVDGFDSRVKLLDVNDPKVAPLAREQRALEARVQEVEDRRQALKAASIDAETRSSLDRLEADLAGSESEIKALPMPETVYSVVPRPPRPIQRLRRGDVEQPGETMSAGALACVPGLDPEFKLANPDDEGSRRAALAEWLASPKNMLTWRSIVNRVWQYHIGRGIVDTPSDFGRNGSKPTHPELLDWLAVEFLEHGQSLKALHRLIVRSAVYRQDSRGDRASEAIDADNRFLWRMNRQRLDAEELRDSVLAISGTLDLRMGGPGFDLFRFKDDHSPIYDHTDPDAIDNPRVRRRTIYRFIVRSVPNPFLECLDTADPNANVPVRNTTITALQALAMLNDLFVVKQSRAFAGRLEAMGGVRAGQVENAYLLALGRPPRADERAALAAYAEKHGLANACRLLFNTNEFVFVD